MQTKLVIAKTVVQYENFVRTISPVKYNHVACVATKGDIRYVYVNQYMPDKARGYSRDSEVILLDSCLLPIELDGMYQKVTHV